jgi:multidrug resistance efflux pump
MRIERLIYSVLILIAATLAIINWRRAALFKADNEELRSQVEMLQGEADNSGRLVEVTRENAQKVRAQAKELAELRDEIARLRGDRKQAAVP